ncbi:hypothetical protein GCM10023213_33310 [Prosthecobacter algae]|uniref:ACT domain-containing protein n=1 Tax=Prosthecobacter algae TaxID=1144682 RepID=A0ABP9PEY3_9BACT
MKNESRLRIDPFAVDQLVGQPHPPIFFTSENDRLEFADRVYENGCRLFDCLTNAGFVGSKSGLEDEEIDFYMSHDASSFRMLSFIVKSERMLVHDLVPMVMEFLNSIGESYSIHVTCDIADSTELFFIFVTTFEAIAAFETSEMAKKLGFDHHSPLIGPIS